MDKINWEERFATGFHSIDFQHKILIGIINDLIDASKAQQENELWLDVVLDELRSYTKYHFSNEALLMGKFKYSDIHSHSEQHADFVKKLDTFSKDYQAKKVNISQELLDYLRDWLINHIVVEDKKLGAFLIEKEQGDDLKDFPFP